MYNAVITIVGLTTIVIKHNLYLINLKKLVPYAEIM